MSCKRGYLHIFNIVEDREGSIKDVHLLKETFEFMGAEVEYTEDPDESVLKNEMIKIKSKDFTDYLYVAIAYMSHGTQDGVVKLKDEKLMIVQKTILVPLCRMKSLDGKLKWLILQTCRGPYDFIEQSAEGPVPTITFPKYCAKFFATSEGMRAFRQKSGSFFIKALCARLKEEFKEHDIITIFNHLRYDVTEKCMLYEEKQIPDVEENFGKKKFYIISGFK